MSENKGTADACSLVRINLKRYAQRQLNFAFGGEACTRSLRRCRIHSQVDGLIEAAVLVLRSIQNIEALNAELRDDTLGS